MHFDKKLSAILTKVQNGEAPSKKDCVYLLEFDENSLEAAMIRATANDLTRQKNENSAIILGQIGIDVAACTGNCKFCVFGQDHARFPEKRLTDEEIIQKLHEFTDVGDLYGLFLMTMHTYELETMLNAVRIAKRIAPKTTQIWANVGDSDLDTFKEMKKAGVKGAYHVCRIGEGRDTSLNPKDRRKTMENIIDAGLELYTCCEPIGPEHTPQELVDNMFIGIELGCTQHAAMRRVAVPGVPLSVHGQITELRLAQIVAVVTLAASRVKNLTYVGVHEPNLLGYTSGASIVTAESGANPRDAVLETLSNRGMTTANCRKMLFEAGFRNIRRGDESKIPLNINYLKETKSF